MDIKRNFGLDGVDLALHGLTTAFLAGLVAEAMGPPQDDVGVFATLTVSVLFLIWRRARALKRMAEAPPSHDELADLHARVAELEQAQGRVLELEERLDFTERLLMQQREQETARLAPGGSH